MSVALRRRVALFLFAALSPCLLEAQGPPPPKRYPVATLRLPPTLPHDGVRVTRITGEDFVTDPTVGIPGTLITIGGVLWIVDQMGNPFLHAAGIADGSVQRSLGPKGGGPGDFQSIVNVSARPGDAALWAYDVSLKRITRVPLQARDAKSSRTIALTGFGFIPRALWLTPDRLVLIGKTDTARFTFVDSLGRRTAVAAGPLLGTPRVTKAVREESSDGIYACARPGGDRFAIAYIRASRVDIFDGNGRKVGDARVPVPNRDEGDFFLDDGGVWRAPAPRRYYSGCAATRDRLYALFAGRLEGAGPPGTKRWEGEYVHVFDWAGGLVSVLRIDANAQSIAVSGDTLLFVGGESLAGVRRYRLPVNPSQR